MRWRGLVLGCAGLAAAIGPGAAAARTEAAAPSPRDPRAAAALEQLGWRLGVQAWTFNEFSFFEAVDKVAALGVTDIEPYPGQKLKPGSAVEVGPEMSATALTEMKAKLASAGLTVRDFGVVDLGDDEAWNRKVFDFAKALGVVNLVAEPPEATLPAIDKLCAEYGINVAFHNHPKPARYWDPNRELEAFKGRSPRIGACCDIGHWMRSGVDPLATLERLKGRVLCSHFKDLNAFGDPDAHDVPWGTGKGRAAELLAQLKRQGAHPEFSVEYETGGPDLMAHVAACIAFFDRQAIALAGSPREGASATR